MAATATKISPKQISCIHALAKVGNLDSDTLYSHIERVTGQTSIKVLSQAQGIAVIESLKRILGQEATGQHNRASKRQIAVILALAAKLGWAEEPARLTGFLEKRYGVSHPRFLDEQKTNNCIEALKAMLAGGRGERKGQGRGKVDGTSNN